MNTSVATSEPLAFTESQKRALLTLLTDEDPEVYQAIRNTILDQGAAARDWLRAHTLSSDPVLRRRALEIINHFERQQSDNRFLAFCLSRGQDFNLEQGVWLLARTQYPDINVTAYSAVLDGFAGDLMERIDFGASAGRILATINYYLFQELHLEGDRRNYYDPVNSYLNRVMDRRLGNPLSLSVLYIFLARRLRLPVVGIGMPSHFICRFQTSREEIYIDPFNRGKLMTRGECMKALIQSGHDYHDGSLSPVTPRRVLLRMCSNLHHIHSTRDSAAETMRLQRYIVALSK